MKFSEPNESQGLSMRGPALRAESVPAVPHVRGGTAVSQMSG